MLRKLGSYLLQRTGRGPARAGPISSARCSTPDWLQSVELRRRVHAGLNKGEARNAAAGGVLQPPWGNCQDRSFEQQRAGASGLNLGDGGYRAVNTVYRTRYPSWSRPASRTASRTRRRWAGSTSTHRRLRSAAEPQTEDGKFRPTDARKP